MAHNDPKNVKPGTAQARLSEDETLRVAFIADTPIEAGKIAESEPVDLFGNARRISKPEEGRGAKDDGGERRTAIPSSNT